MRLNAHFGELPSGAFQHCGDRKIKLQGGGGGFIDDVVDAVVDPVKDAGSWIDDKVREEVPAGWLGVAALAGGAYLGAEAIAAGNAAESAALAQGATAAEAAAAGAEAATAAEAAIGGISAESSGVGLNPAIGSGVGASSGIGIDTGLLGGTEYLGGASSLPAGTAGLTAEQLALAGGAASDAAATSGLGYLGGAEALPTGTAGITTTVPAESAITPTEAIRGAQLANSLLAGTPTTPTTTPKNVVPRGVVSYDPLLSLLTMKASRPNILSLLG